MYYSFSLQRCLQIYSIEHNYSTIRCYYHILSPCFGMFSSESVMLDDDKVFSHMRAVKGETEDDRFLYCLL